MCGKCVVQARERAVRGMARAASSAREMPANHAGKPRVFGLSWLYSAPLFMASSDCIWSLAVTTAME